MSVFCPYLIFDAFADDVGEITRGGVALAAGHVAQTVVVGGDATAAGGEHEGQRQRKYLHVCFVRSQRSSSDSSLFMAGETLLPESMDGDRHELNFCILPTIKLSLYDTICKSCTCHVVLPSISSLKHCIMKLLLRLPHSKSIIGGVYNDVSQSLFLSTLLKVSNSHTAGHVKRRLKRTVRSASVSLHRRSHSSE